MKTGIQVEWISKQESIFLGPEPISPTVWNILSWIAVVRSSKASLAMIKHDNKWLVYWNQDWKQYSLVGGNLEENETAHECLVRAMEKKLRLQDIQQYYAMSDEPDYVLEYEAFSKSMQMDTLYCIALYNVVLTEEERKIVNARDDIKWVDWSEIEQGRCADTDEPIAEAVGYLIESSQRLAGEQE